MASSSGADPLLLAIACPHQCPYCVKAHGGAGAVPRAPAWVALSRFYVPIILDTLYHERTTIEAFFCQSRHVYNIQNLRSRKFTAIYAFLRFVVLTHNVLHWAKQVRLAPTELAMATTRQLVCYAARVRAHIRWDGRWHIAIIPSSRWASALIEALTCPPQPVQLALPFARLRKT